MHWAGRMADTMADLMAASTEYRRAEMTVAHWVVRWVAESAEKTAGPTADYSVGLKADNSVAKMAD